jgi:hypothetical protein
MFLQLREAGGGGEPAKPRRVAVDGGLLFDHFETFMDSDVGSHEESSPTTTSARPRS